jgi:hypothetical protein
MSSSAPSATRCAYQDLRATCSAYEPRVATCAWCIRRAARRLEARRAEVENAYPRAVHGNGNAVAQAMLDDVFETPDQQWRGIGSIPTSGWRLSPSYRDFDAELRFAVEHLHVGESPSCRAGGRAAHRSGGAIDRRSTVGVHHRQLRRAPPLLPRRKHRRPRGARHGQRPRHGRDPPLAPSTAFVPEEGSNSRCSVGWPARWGLPRPGRECSS